MEQDVEKYKERLKGFSKLDREQRLLILKELGVLTEQDIEALNTEKKLSINFAENFIENVIGYFEVPMGVAANFIIDNKARIIPMVVEETSIIAAASKTAAWVCKNGSISTSVLGNEAIGQVQIPKVKDLDALKKIVLDNSKKWIEILNQKVAQGLVKRGGGVTRIDFRHWESEDKTITAVLHIYVNTCDAMGANIVNQICEYLSRCIQKVSLETIGLCILSNLADSKLTIARIEMDIEEELGLKIQQASQFSWEDPYRAATNNKGVLNGIDPILIATGNDWRAVEAGIHAYAAKNGQYRSVTRWTYKNNRLIGEFKAPIVLGVVGGVTALHPTAQMNLRMMGVQSAEELSRICAAVGLVQNLGALRALTTVGIIEGHMKLHIKNLSVGVGATQEEIPLMQEKLENILSIKKRISFSNAKEVLETLRKLEPSQEFNSRY